VPSQHHIDPPDPNRLGPEPTPGACEAPGPEVEQQKVRAGAIPQGGTPDGPAKHHPWFIAHQATV